MAGVRAGTGGCIPADGGDDVLDAVVVRSGIDCCGAVTGAVTGGA